MLYACVCCMRVCMLYVCVFACARTHACMCCVCLCRVVQTGNITLLHSYYTPNNYGYPNLCNAAAGLINNYIIVCEGLT